MGGWDRAMSWAPVIRMRQQLIFLQSKDGRMGGWDRAMSWAPVIRMRQQLIFLQSEDEVSFPAG
eukprot:CAMPEP_0174912710 /NCGR_PEP_ID=MMETSP0167-20121228/79929_1 /TAXON_ID=38298 /ORGANISM="Rhodella maculata, Strain CCMP736" /LENGTH=63 /DNA_ID=CAMNT_0016157375 /DNA_START=422 /DNA_END=613 /DNA_ORIENTATION=+